MKNGKSACYVIILANCWNSLKKRTEWLLCQLSLVAQRRCFQWSEYSCALHITTSLYPRMSSKTKNMFSLSPNTSHLKICFRHCWTLMMLINCKYLDYCRLTKNISWRRLFSTTSRSRPWLATLNRENSPFLCLFNFPALTLTIKVWAFFSIKIQWF